VKAIILAGGFGTRISEETSTRPKPMIEIGGKPILWHIFKIYAAHGISEFIVCCGYKGYVIKEYFANYFLHMSDVTFDMASNKMQVHQENAEPWKVTLVDTGENTQTGGRLKRVAQYLGDQDFCMTYGDGLSNIDIAATIKLHKENQKLATMTVVKPPGRFGAVELNEKSVSRFLEKPKGDGGWINGGFFVLSPKVIELIDGDDVCWEQFPLETLASNGELMAYKHDGFWQSMDTLRDKLVLDNYWSTGQAPWKIWS